MYIGRFLVVGPSVGAYRVSSRSFPNRRTVKRGTTVTVSPTEDAASSDNPYIAYNCLRLTERGAVIGNGSHVDPIAEKLELGLPARDAMATPLLALDYEKDEYDTPRIAGIVGIDDEDPSAGSAGAIIGIVRRDGLVVDAITEPTLVATYELDTPQPTELTATDAVTAAREVYDAPYEHPVCSAGVSTTAEGYQIAIVNEEP